MAFADKERMDLADTHRSRAGWMMAATPERQAAHNRRLILKYIKECGPVSRADISRDIGLSFPSVSANVRTLLRDGYLYSTGAGDNALGRKADMLAYRATRGYALGLDVGRYQVRLLLTDLLGNALLTLTSEPRPLRGEQRLSEEVAALLREALRRSGIDPRLVLCAGVGVPGIPNPSGDRIALNPYIDDFGMSELRRTLTDTLGELPVLIDNSVNYGAIGEYRDGAGKGCRDMLYVNYGIGVGSALIIGGALYRGANGAAGETGYMVSGRADLRSAFEEEGVMERRISGYRLAGALGGQDEREAVVGLFDRYRRGDAQAVAQVDALIDYAGMMFVNAASVVNPALIILSGGVGLALSAFAMDRWRDMLRAHVPYPPEIVCSTLHNLANVRGAVAVALDAIDRQEDGAV